MRTKFGLGEERVSMRGGLHKLRIIRFAIKRFPFFRSLGELNKVPVIFSLVFSPPPETNFRPCQSAVRTEDGDSIREDRWYAKRKPPTKPKTVHTRNGTLRGARVRSAYSVEGHKALSR